jgi:hypothetical protein
VVAEALSANESGTRLVFADRAATQEHYAAYEGTSKRSEPLPTTAISRASARPKVSSPTASSWTISLRGTRWDSRPQCRRPLPSPRTSLRDGGLLHASAAPS